MQAMEMIDPVYSSKDFYRYPSDNVEIFEDYFNRTFVAGGEPRIYLPVAWTSYYRRANYGRDSAMILSLQKQLNRLDATKKYFTVCTWDDGILNNVKHLDLQVFAACGNRIDFPIPLLCRPHRYYPPHINKRIKCSFVGSLNHPIRNEIVGELTGKDGFYISTSHHHMEKYCAILNESKYVLCPRGYGQTSFRICEAIQYGAIPIYISDQLVYTDGTIPLKAGLTTIDEIKEIVETNAKPKTKGVYDYEGLKNLIIENINP